jgi:5'(3')-deoxyribonucleotidase
MRRYNDEFGSSLESDDVLSWDGLLGLTHFAHMDEFWVWSRDPLPSVFRHLPVIDGALETLRDLAREHWLVVISSKHDWAIPDTLEWLAEHRVPAREIHFVWDKTTVECDAYLEDAPHNLEALCARRPGSAVCRMVQPWNTALDGCVDIAHWGEFAKLVEQIASGEVVPGRS